jgi:hypothetical protein
MVVVAVVVVMQTQLLVLEAQAAVAMDQMETQHLPLGE